MGCCKKNDVNILDKLIHGLKYYEIDEQTYLYKKTPLHYAVKYKSPRAILFLIKNKADKHKKNSNGLTPLETIEKVKFPDKKWISVAKRIIDKEIKEFTELDLLEINKDKNNNIKLSQRHNKNKIDENENKNSFGKNFITNMRLINLMSQIKEHIDNNKIDLKIMFDKYDKNKIGKISINEFTNIFKELKVPEIEKEDIDYMLICLDVNKDGKLPYKEFISLLT